ncbi:MAG: hypothetical protein U1E27_02880, partial [Kiritimatiellia bacterium]|nr:hypothetical protein [Kiritimatiellia bacterium]
MNPRPVFGRIRSLVFFLAFTGALLPGPTAARVFRQIPGGWHGATSAGRPGWTLAYEARYRINGGGARIEALGCGLPLFDALRALEATYRERGAAVRVFGGERQGWGIAVADEAVIRFLVVEVGRPGECLVFRIEQSAEEFRQSM